MLFPLNQGRNLRLGGCRVLQKRKGRTACDGLSGLFDIDRVRCGMLGGPSIGMRRELSYHQFVSCIVGAI